MRLKFNILNFSVHGTDADPFNSKRGFLFSHIGWLTSSKPHSAFDDEMKKMEFNDIKYDQLLKFQSKNYFNLVALVSFMFPLCVNVYILGASPFVAWHWNMLRILIALHWSLVLNSMGSYFGSKPYDKGIAPRDSQALSLLTLGEGKNFIKIDELEVNGCFFQKVSATIIMSTHGTTR